MNSLLLSQKLSLNQGILGFVFKAHDKLGLSSRTSLNDVTFLEPTTVRIYEHFLFYSALFHEDMLLELVCIFMQELQYF